MFHVELAPWGVFLPSEVRFRGILALSRAWFYNGQKQKCKFLKKGSLPDFQILCGDSWGIFTKNGTNLRPGEFFFGFDPFRQLCTIHRAALTAKKKTGKCRKEEKKPIYYPQVVMRKSGKQVECTGAVLAPKWVDFSSFIPILYSVVFLLVRPKKWQRVRLHVNPFKKVLSVRIS